MKIIDGKAISREILSLLAARAHPKTHLTGILAEGDAASESYQAMKKRAAETAGIEYRIVSLPATSSTADILAAVKDAAEDASCGGVVVQLPLPAGVDTDAVLNAIPPEKDIDVLGERARHMDEAVRGIYPPAVSTVAEILGREGWIGKGKIIAVVGPGRLIGRPVAAWLLKDRIGAVTIVGEGSDLSVLSRADLIILGAGHAGLVTSAMLKDGAAVIDFGTAKNNEGALAGDFLPTPLDGKLSFYTPTPGGTGPILIAKLLENFVAVDAARKSRNAASSATLSS